MRLTKRQKEMIDLKSQINIIENNVKETCLKINTMNDILHDLVNSTALCDDTNATVESILNFCNNDVTTSVGVDYGFDGIKEDIKDLRLTVSTLEDAIMDMLNSKIEKKIDKQLDVYSSKILNHFNHLNYQDEQQDEQNEIRYSILTDLLQENLKSNKEICKKLKKLEGKVEGKKD